MESTLATLVAQFGSEAISAGVGLLIATALGFLLHRKPIQEIRRELRELRDRQYQTERANQSKPKRPESPLDGNDEEIDIINALRLVASHIEPSTDGFLDVEALAIQHSILEEFRTIPGAMLGNNKYNRVMLGYWIKARAAEKLIEDYASNELPRPLHGGVRNRRQDDG